jgi:SNF2 family DNA or RNA helicase
MHLDTLHSDLDLPSTLRPYQWEGVNFLVQGASTLLADEMGLGKTVQTAVALQILIKHRQCNRVLIVCPASLCHNWEVELKRWAPNISVRRIRGNFEDRKAHFRLPFKIWIASYEQIRSDIDFLHKEIHYDIVILDEAQRIKNVNTSLALACRQLRRSRAWALTGTPIENRPEDLLSIFAFLKPGLLQSALTRSDIHERITPHFLRRRKKEVLNDLPPIIIQDMILEMEGKQKEVYFQEWINSRENIRNSRGSYSVMGLLAQITKLKLICNFEPDSGESCKLEALLTMIDSLNDDNDKIIIFSQYVKTLKRIRRSLVGLPVDIFHGELDYEARTRIITDFQNSSGPRILLVSLKAGGVGLNLGTASIVILFDRWWNPAIEDQAIQRAHRYGRKTPLHVIRFIVAETIEERIEEILKSKQLTFNNYIENAKIAEVEMLTYDEMIRIFGLGSGSEYV